MQTVRKIPLLYEVFSSVEGNQYIASEYAIKRIQYLINKFQIQSVLEIGLGIGSISNILLTLNDGLSYTGTEKNKFCLESLPKNLGYQYTRLRIYDEIGAIPEDSQFDLIIIDGKDKKLNDLKNYVKPQGIIVIEGDRLSQEELMFKIFPRNKRVHSISLSKNSGNGPFSTDSWQGGLKIIFVDPSIKQLLWWMKEKVMTKIKYQYPGRYLGKA